MTEHGEIIRRALVDGREGFFESINKSSRESRIRKEIRYLEDRVRTLEHSLFLHINLPIKVDDYTLKEEQKELLQAQIQLKEAQKRLKIIQIDADESKAEESVIRKIKILKIEIHRQENFLRNKKGVLAKIRYPKEIKEAQRLLEQLQIELEEVQRNLEIMKRNFDKRRRAEIEAIEKKFGEGCREKVETIEEKNDEEPSKEEVEGR